MKNKGFTFIEVIIAAAVFILFSMGAYQAYTAVLAASAAAHHKALAADLANEQFEIVKNMPYSNVGTVGGTPSGILSSVQTLVRDNVSFTVNIYVENIDDPFDGLAGGIDIFPADYKLVEISVSCDTCKNFTPVVFSGRVAPANLESS